MSSKKLINDPEQAPVEATEGYVALSRGRVRQVPGMTVVARTDMPVQGRVGVVIGGGSLMGGQGSILGSVIGALIITILYMGGQQMGWPKWVQETVIGVIIIAAVVIDRLRQQSTT